MQAWLSLLSGSHYRLLFMTHHTPAHPARQHWLSVGGSNYSGKDHFPDMGTVQLSAA
jgi:hypothetical protein